MASKEITFKISVDVTGLPPEMSVGLFSVEDLTTQAPDGKRYGYLGENDQIIWSPGTAEDKVHPGWRKLYVEKRTSEMLFGADAGPVGQHPGGGCLWPDRQCIGHPA